MRSLSAQRLEGPIRRIAKEFDRVLIRAMWRNALPRITVKANEIADLPRFRTYTAHARDRVAAEDWIDNGGVLFNMHPTPTFKPETDAFVWCEAPFSMSHFRELTARTKHLCLVHRPISWEEHRNTVRDTHPSGEDALRLFEYLKRCKDNEKPEHRAMAVALGHDDDGVFAVSDRDISDALHLNIGNLAAMRKAIKTCISGYQFEQCLPVILRVPPDTVEEKLVYQNIQINAPKVAKWNIIDPTKMSRVHKNWKFILKQMARHGNLQREWPVYFYYLTGRQPDIESRTADLAQAMADLAEVESFVKSLDAYPVQ